MKVALIHDWLTGMRGGERVLELFCQLFPQADIFTLIHTKGHLSPIIEQRNIRTSFLQKFPWIDKKYRFYLPLMPTAIEQFNLEGYDLVISCSHCVAKGVITSPETCHICYCFTPMRYVWDLYHQYFRAKNLGWFPRRIIPPIINYLRIWDCTSANRVDYFVAISHYVARRIKKYYRRDSWVVHPPIDTSLFIPNNRPKEYFLTVTAFAPYKRIDLAIQAFKLLNYPLKIVGTGPEEKYLRSIAPKNIEFLGWQPDNVLQELYAGCRAFVFPGKEDFGLTPLEAQSAGRPVIAYGQGGVWETVIPMNGHTYLSGTDTRQGSPYQGNSQYSPTGIFFFEQSAEALVEAVKYFEQVEDIFDPEKIREHALRFNPALFKEKIVKLITDVYEEFQQQRQSQGLLQVRRQEDIV
jgi:glycosyltransferase involved in cell wall biosynthesis